MDRQKNFLSNKFKHANTYLIVLMLSLALAQESPLSQAVWTFIQNIYRDNFTKVIGAQQTQVDSSQLSWSLDDRMTWLESAAARPDWADSEILSLNIDEAVANINAIILLLDEQSASTADASAGLRRELLDLREFLETDWENATRYYEEYIDGQFYSEFNSILVAEMESHSYLANAVYPLLDFNWANPNLSNLLIHAISAFLSTMVIMAFFKAMKKFKRIYGFRAKTRRNTLARNSSLRTKHDLSDQAESSADGLVEELAEPQESQSTLSM